MTSASESSPPQGKTSVSTLQGTDSVFSKTGTSRQPELVRLLLTLPTVAAQSFLPDSE